MHTRIIIDSATDLTKPFQDQMSVVSLTVAFADEQVADQISLTREEFYQRLETSPVLPTTSQASPAQYAALFQEIAEAGDSAVVITLASQLSGTYQSAMIAASDFEQIYVVDSNTATIGIGILAQRALQLRDAGMDAASIAKTLEQEKTQIRLVAVLDTLEYLKRGGRISKTVALAGGILNIKPMISVENGQIQVIGKPRGNKQGNQMMRDWVNSVGGIDPRRPWLLGYTGLSDELLQRLIAENAALWPDTPQVAGIGSIIGVHAGPGAVAIAFFQPNE